MERTKLILSLVLGIAILPSALLAAPPPDSLPRRAFLGVQIAPLTSEAKEAAKYVGEGGIVIAALLPGASAEAGGKLYGTPVMSDAAG